MAIFSKVYQAAAPDTAAINGDGVTGVVMVTASASGLNPDISVVYATRQATRVARERGADLAAVQALIGEYTTGRALGFMGEAAVDVLELNLALDRRFPARG